MKNTIYNKDSTIFKLETQLIYYGNTIEALENRLIKLEELLLDNCPTVYEWHIRNRKLQLNSLYGTFKGGD